MVVSIAGTSRHKPSLGTILNKAHPLARGLVGCWLFNEGTGNKVFDLSGYGNRGDFNTSGTAWTSGDDGSAIDFDGVNGDIDITQFILNPSQTDFTVLMSINADSFGHLDVNNDAAIILQQLGINGRTWLFIRRINSTIFRLRSFLGGSTIDTTINWNALTGIWKSIAVRYDGTNIKLYIDGVEDGSAGRTMESASGLMRIAKHKSPSTTSEEFDGKVKYLYIYNRALTAAEIAQLYREPYGMFERISLARFFVPAVGAYSINAAPGSYALSGQAATLLADRVLNAGTGLYSLVGVNASLVAGKVIVASPGSYLVSGVAATLVYTPVGAFAINAEPGAYALSGQVAGLIADRVLSTNVGVYLVTGQAASILAGRILSANPGAYVITGISAQLIAERVLSLSPEVYNITGQDVGAVAGRVIPADPGAYNVTGQATTLLGTFLLELEPGNYLVVGNVADLEAVITEIEYLKELKVVQKGPFTVIYKDKPFEVK